MNTFCERKTKKTKDDPDPKLPDRNELLAKLSADSIVVSYTNPLTLIVYSPNLPVVMEMLKDIGLASYKLEEYRPDYNPLELHEDAIEIHNRSYRIYIDQISTAFRRLGLNVPRKKNQNDAIYAVVKSGKDANDEKAIKNFIKELKEITANRNTRIGRRGYNAYIHSN